jgi:hypothetical protein
MPPAGQLQSVERIAATLSPLAFPDVQITAATILP